MSRLLLALLAILTGISASGGNAQVRACAMGEAEVALLSALAGAESTNESDVAAAPEQLTTPVRIDAALTALTLPASLATSTVHIKADRARE